MPKVYTDNGSNLLSYCNDAKILFYIFTPHGTDIQQVLKITVQRHAICHCTVIFSNGYKDNNSSRFFILKSHSG